MQKANAQVKDQPLRAADKAEGKSSRARKRTGSVEK